MASRDYEMLFGSIDAGNVDNTIGRLAKAWYFVAALLVAPQIFLIWTSGTVSENLADAVICALGGYFLGARRSRAVAVSLFIYTLAVITMTFAAKWGARGGTNIILALAF